METILDYIDLQARVTPDHTFLADRERALTFREFSSLVKKMSYLLHKEKITKGERVLLYVNNRINHIISYFATMSIGAIAVHVYPEKKWEYVRFAVELTGASMVVTDKSPESENIASPVYPFPSFEENSQEYSSKERSEVAYMMFTSGTTGRPKAVMTTHANILYTARTVIKIAGMKPGDREIIFLPLGSTGGLGHLHCSLMLGNFAFLYHKFFLAIDQREITQILNLIESHRVTGFLATPHVLIQLLESHRERFQLLGKNLNYILANVHPMKEDVIKEIISLLRGVRFAMYYGLTEASRSAYNIYSETGKYSKTGQAASGVSLKIAHQDSETGIGEVLIKGPNVAQGYWGKGSFVDEEGWFSSGDAGSLDKDGFLTIHGRVDELISVGGMKSTPAEIEAVLKSFPGITESAVVGVEDENTYQKICAAIVLEEGVDPKTLRKELNTFLDEKLEFYKKPVEITILQDLPKTELGKVQRKKVKEYFK